MHINIAFSCVFKSLFSLFCLKNEFNDVDNFLDETLYANTHYINKIIPAIDDINNSWFFCL
jgi:hypothetical protein